MNMPNGDQMMIAQSDLIAMIGELNIQNFALRKRIIDLDAEVEKLKGQIAELTDKE